MNLKTLLRSAAASLVVVFILSTTVAWAQTWAPPNVAPPNGNVPAPINVGGTAQTRNGALTILNLLTVGNLNAIGPALIANGTSALKYFTQIGQGMTGNGLALDVTGVNNNILSSIFNALYTGIIRVESLSHAPTANEPMAVCATPDGDLVLCAGGGNSYSINSFSASPSQVNPNTGGNSTLSWNTTGFSSCSAATNNYGFSTSGNTNGTDQVTGISAATTFTLNCVTATGVAQSATTSVGIVTGPVDPNTAINSFTATPSSIFSGSTTMLAWDTVGYDTCVAGANNVGFSTSGNTDGTDPTTAIIVSGTITKTFTLSCTTASGTTNTATTSVVVNAVAAPTVSLTTNDASVSLGQNYILTWESSNIRPSGGLNTPQCVATSTNQSTTNWTGYKSGNTTSGNAGFSTTVTSSAVGTYVHTITCYGVTGTPVTDSVTVTVTNAATPLFTINATNNLGPVTAKTHGVISANGTNVVSGSEKIYYCKSSGSCGAGAIPGNLTGYTLSTTSGIGGVDYYYNLNGLTSSSTYYFKYCVTYNGSQTACSGINSFATLAAGTPTVTLNYNNVAVQGDTKSVAANNTTFTLGFTSTNATECGFSNNRASQTWESNGYNPGQTTLANQTLNLGQFVNNNTPSNVTLSVECKNSNNQVATNWVTVELTQPVSTSLHYKAPGAGSFTLLATTPMTATVSSANAQFYLGTSNNNATLCRKTSVPTVPGWSTTWNANDALANASPSSPALTLNGNSSVVFTYECKNNLNVVSSRVLTVNYVSPITVTQVNVAPIGFSTATVTAQISGASNGYVQYATGAGAVANATHQVGTLTGNSFSKQLQNLTASTQYYYRVCGNTGNTTVCSPVDDFTTTALTAPTLTSPSASAINASGGNITTTLNMHDGINRTTEKLYYCKSGSAGCGPSTVPSNGGVNMNYNVGGALTVALSGLDFASVYYTKACVNYNYPGDNTLRTACSVIGSMTTTPAPATFSNKVVANANVVVNGSITTFKKSASVTITPNGQNINAASFRYCVAANDCTANSIGQNANLLGATLTKSGNTTTWTGLTGSLTPGATYYYKFEAYTPNFGATFNDGAIGTFTVPLYPSMNPQMDAVNTHYFTSLWNFQTSHIIALEGDISAIAGNVPGAPTFSTMINNAYNASNVFFSVKKDTDPNWQNFTAGINAWCNPGCTSAPFSSTSYVLSNNQQTRQGAYQLKMCVTFNNGNATQTLCSNPMTYNVTQ